MDEGERIFIITIIGIICAVVFCIFAYIWSDKKDRGEYDNFIESSMMLRKHLAELEEKIKQAKKSKLGQVEFKDSVPIEILAQYERDYSMYRCCNPGKVCLGNTTRDFEGCKYCWEDFVKRRYEGYAARRRV